MDETPPILNRSTNQTSPFDGTNKLLIIVLVLFIVVIVGLGGYLFIKKTPPVEPKNNEQPVIKPTNSQQFTGNPYQNNNPFNLTSYYKSLEIIKKLGATNTPTFGLKLMGDVTNVTLDIPNKTLSLKIRDDKDRILRLQWDSTVFDKVKVVQMINNHNTFISLSEITVGKKITIEETYDAKADDYTSALQKSEIMIL